MSTQTKHRWALDAIEEGMARVEEDGERMISIPIHLLPAGAKEGQLLRLERTPAADGGGMVLTITIDEAIQYAAEKALKLLDRIGAETDFI